MIRWFTTIHSHDPEGYKENVALVMVAIPIDKDILMRKAADFLRENKGIEYVSIDLEAKKLTAEGLIAFVADETEKVWLQDPEIARVFIMDTGFAELQLSYPGSRYGDSGGLVGYHSLSNKPHEVENDCILIDDEFVDMLVNDEPELVGVVKETMNQLGLSDELSRILTLVEEDSSSKVRASR
jgi:sensor c-di-GMP phosphodiesterase-like protein